MAQHHHHPFLSAILSNIFLFVLIFGLSATVHGKNLQRQLEHKRTVGVGLLLQYVIMPLLGFATVKLFSATTTTSKQPHGFTHAMGFMLLIVTSSPGGSFSNWWCSTFNADLALSVTMTTVSSIVSLGLLPANVLLYTFLAYGMHNNNNITNPADDDSNNNRIAPSSSVMESLDFTTILLSLSIALTAMICGLTAGYVYNSPKFHTWCNRIGSLSGVALVVFMLLLSSGVDTGDGATAWWQQDKSVFFAITLVCGSGILVAHGTMKYCCGNGGGGGTLRALSPPEIVAMTIECSYQNIGIATSAAITMYRHNDALRSQAMAVPMIFGIVQAILICIYCIVAWKAGWTKAPKDEKICVVVSKSYEIEEDLDKKLDLPSGDKQQQTSYSSGETNSQGTSDDLTEIVCDDVEHGD